MDALLEILSSLPEFSDMLGRIRNKGCPVAMGGLSAVHKAHMGAAVHRLTGRPLLVVCADELECARLSADMEAMLALTPASLPAREFTFYNAESASREWEHRRLGTLHALGTNNAPVCCASVDALMQRTLPPATLLALSLTLEPGMKLKPAALAERLVESGYTRCEQVEGPGQFAMRGGILDYYSAAEQYPVRVEFFGDEIDTLSAVDPVSQRRTVNLKFAAVLPYAEVLPYAAPKGTIGLIADMEELLRKTAGRKGVPPALAQTITQDIERLREGVSFPAVDRYIELIYPDMTTALDYLPSDTVIVFSDHARLAERAKNYLWQQGQDIEAMLEGGVLAGAVARFSIDFDGLNAKAGAFDCVYFDTFISSAYDLPPHRIYSVLAKQLPSYGGSLDTALGDIRHHREGGGRSLVLCSSERRARQMYATLTENDVEAGLALPLEAMPPPGAMVVTVGGLSAGFEYPALGLAVITEGQLIVSAAHRTKRPVRDKTGRQRLNTYADLSPGDMVVHEYHGIGRFTGIVRMPIDNIERDYIKIAYMGTDSLYVPVTQLDLVCKYIGGGGEDSPVKLSKLGGTEWQRAKSRAKAAAKDLAKDLIALYAARARREGFAFPPDSEWQLEFEESFEYDETDDQLRCAAEIKADMELSLPMERLLCGDVGFGKTEVALRAMMKCVTAGKQAAILVPTTVLAQQHHNTITKRFSNYPVRVVMLSRFRTPKQIKETLRRLSTSQCDIVVGTHRLLQKDVTFNDLGLLVVDEEQRFGVAHKERLKEIAQQVDVLTLTATPIPRTLNMALSGIRDMSTIEEPPRDRHPVQTYVLEHDWSIIADAIRREVSRGGQVYYLHNRIDTIERVAARVAGMAEGLSVVAAHGQMEEKALSDIMRRMTEGEINVLVCTTIIESGIDIPNVNTLIVEEADTLGLAQLHQIRGRVGRSARHAFAYLTYRRGKVLSEVATKRLSAVREFAEFGSGFKIAMRDLEIRGAGNVLGSEQSGHMMSVGYDMYLKLLEEAVLEEQGQKVPTQECTADIVISAGIPDSYIPSPEMRMDIYRRIARIRTDEDSSDVIDELVDRFGDPPPGVTALVSVALLRAAAASAGISEITQRGTSLNLTLRHTDIARVGALCALPEYKGRLLFSAGESPYLSLRLKQGDDVLDMAKTLVGKYGVEKKDKK